MVVDGSNGKRQDRSGGIDVLEPTATVDRIIRRAYNRRQDPEPTDLDYDSDDDDYPSPSPTMPTTTTAAATTGSSGTPAVRRLSRPQDVTNMFSSFLQ